MLVFQVLVVIILGSVGVTGVTREATDEEYAQFPRLFHLDDYDACMLRPDALYCLGTFEIVPDHRNPLYRLLEEYSSDVKNFNRTRLHRGYCISERCPEPKQRTGSKDLDVLEPPRQRFSNHSHFHHEDQLSRVQQFERCISRWSQKHQLHVKLSSLQYCHTRQDVVEEWKMETPHLVFLAVVGLIVMMNVLGTLYDVMYTGQKSKLVTSWSMWSNWTHLVGDFPAGDPRVPPRMQLEAGRFLMMLAVLWTHAGVINGMLYLGNPRYLDQISHKPVMKLIYNGHSTVQLFLLLSSFFLAQKVMEHPRPSYSMLPKMLLKRIVRISPVYLVVVGYAATWWPATGGGPQWPALVDAESAVCRDRFWPLAFFVGNYVNNHQPCLVATWYLQVEIQLYIVMSVVAVWSGRVRRVVALWALAGAFVLSVLAALLLAYVRRWAPLFVTVGPEMVRTTFSKSEVFTSFCTQPVANIGACLAGLFLAHFMAELQERGYFERDHEWLVVGSRAVVPLLPAWTGSAGHLFRDISSRGALALFLALERPLITIIFGYIVFGINANADKVTLTSTRSVQKNKLNALFRNVLACRAMYPLGRLSLAVMMLHWTVNLTFAAARRSLFHATGLNMVTDALATACLSYLAAVPVTLLVDIPAQQMFAALSQ